MPIDNRRFGLAMIRAGYDGLYDNSFEGIIFYNEKKVSS